MNLRLQLCGFFLLSVAHGAVILSNPQPAPVYVVTRPINTEGRALLSARMLVLNAANLFWYEGANVVRADVPPAAIEPLRADRDVLLVLTQEQSQAPTPPAALMQQPPMPPMQMGMNPMGMVGGSGMGGGMPGMGGMAMLDNLAGTVVTRLLNRAPGCKISLAKTPAKFDAVGGDGVVMVNASGTCAWQAQASADWIQITSGAGVSGSGLISYTILPGAKKSRSAVITIAAAPGSTPIHGNASHIVLQTAGTAKID